VALALTTDDLVDDVRLQTCIPTVDGRLGSTEALVDAAILRLADRVMRTHVADLLVATRSERWTAAPADTSITSGTSLYALPSRALAGGAADVRIVDSDGNEWSAPEIGAAQAWRFITGHCGWDSPYAYCWRDNLVELLPHPTTTAYTLRVMYHRHPSRLTAVSDCALLQEYVDATNVEYTSLPSSGWGNGTSHTVDLVQRGPNGLALEDDIPLNVNTVSGNLTRTSGSFTNTAPYASAPSYACPYGTTCVPALPESLWPVLVDGTGLEVLRAIGDPGGSQEARDRLSESVTRARAVLSPRSRGASQKIVARGYGTRRGWR
jgi:hypothetical protein